jgi:hypothetical protein
MADNNVDLVKDAANKEPNALTWAKEQVGARGRP